MASIQRPALPAPRLLRIPRSNRWLLIVAGIIVGVALLQVNQFSRLASTGYEMERLKAERSEKLAENYQLEADVAYYSSLARIEWEARTRLNLVPATRRLYIDVNQPVPAHETLPTRYLPAEAPAAAPPKENDRSLLQQARDLLPF